MSVGPSEMTCDRTPETLAASWKGELSPGEAEALAAHLAACAACRAEAETLSSLWSGLGRLPEEAPSPRLRERFDALLADTIAAERGGRVLRPDFEAGRPRRPIRTSVVRFGAIAASAAIAATLAVGVFVGTEIAGRRDATRMAALADEVASLRETVTLALLAESSPSERLRGVAYGREVSGADARVAEALLDALLADPNVNVRLAALEALRPLALRPDGRPRLVAAIPDQESPLVQLSLIELLLETDSAAARRDLAQLLDNTNLDPVVRAHLRDRLGRSV